MKISALVLDSTYGRSAAGVQARLERITSAGWVKVATAETNSDGWIDDWSAIPLDQGTYRMVFDSDSYFAGLGAATAYPEVFVIFRIPTKFHSCQVQVTLSPYAYSTYFGAGLIRRG